MDSYAVLRQWLEIDYNAVSKKLGFSDITPVVSHELILSTIRCLDYETTMAETVNIDLVIAILALMWSHVNVQEYNLKSVVIKMLSRIGYPTSAIIADEAFDKGECTFSAISSIMDDITLSLMQNSNEIHIGDYTYLLTQFQKQLWDVLDKEKYVGISAPTSAGKSFVILLKTIEKMFQSQMDVIYIVPTLSLLHQVSEDYNAYMQAHNVQNYIITNNFDLKHVEAEHIIYVWTQEKAIAALTSEDWKEYSRKAILVVDEIQNIERVSEDSDVRAKILFDTISELRYVETIAQVIIAGPRIEGIGKLGTDLFGENTVQVDTKHSPVFSLTYSIKKREDDQYFLKQYCGLLNDAYSMPIPKPLSIQGYGSSRITDDYISFLSSIISGLADEQNIIFAPTSNAARKIATGLSVPCVSTDDLLNELAKYYANTVHANYSLCSTLPHGIAYHHGKLPTHVRRTMELAIKNGLISTVACTTTLMQGVNLPAQNIIIRNPHLYTRKGAGEAELTSYEIANLRGRAGRLLRDFIGRTLILDESQFEELDGYEQENMFDDVTKEVPVGYEEKFDVYKDEIWNAVQKESRVNNDMQHYGYLVTYIRQTVMRYGAAAQQRMNNVGVKLTREQVAAIKFKLDHLSVPKEICFRNRYWDPYVLDDIYTSFTGKVPSHPAERGAQTKLSNMLKFLRDSSSAKDMFNKYVPEKYRIGAARGQLCSACIKWATGTPLVDLLEDEYFDGDEGADHVETYIELLQNTAAFNIPLLIKPIVEMFNKDSSIVACLQSGASDPYCRKMIEIGISRELAIRLSGALMSKYSGTGKDDVEIEKEIRGEIAAAYDGLPYWEKAQLTYLIQ